MTPKGEAHSVNGSIVLASASPRRQALLRQLNVEFSVIPADIEERRARQESPAEFVERMALDKARVVWQRMAASERRPVLGSDTIVLVDEEVFGKPTGREQALAMLGRLSGRNHCVMSAVAIFDRHFEVSTNVTEVTFRDIAPWEREAYWATGEPADKAGAYAIQGLGALFVESLNGSYSSVMGLPLYETGCLLRNFGVDALDPLREHAARSPV